MPDIEALIAKARRGAERLMEMPHEDNHQYKTAETLEEYADALEAQQGAIEHLLSLQVRLFAAIVHGDEEHRAWLLEAIVAHFADKPVPASRGKALAALNTPSEGEG